MTSRFSPQSSGGSAGSNLSYSRSSPRTLFNTVMTVLAFVCGILSILPLLAVLIYVLFRGFSSLNLNAFTQLPPPPFVSGGGFGHAIIGTIVVVALAALFSIPFGVLAAIYLTEFSSGKLSRWVRFATNVLSGVPSIIAGVFAYGVVVLTTKTFSAVAGGVALAILMLPIIVRTTDEALQLVSQDLRQAATGLGATKFQTVSQVVLPAAIPAIVTGVTLGIARASGETAPLLFTAQASQYWPSSLFERTASLAVFVYNFGTSPYANLQSLAWAAALILVLLVLLTNIVARWATSRTLK